MIDNDKNDIQRYHILWYNMIQYIMNKFVCKRLQIYIKMLKSIYSYYGLILKDVCKLNRLLYITLNTSQILIASFDIWWY